MIDRSRSSTKLAALPVLVQERIVARISTHWPRLSAREQLRAATLYGTSYRHATHVPALLRLYALHCDERARATLVRTLPRHRALSALLDTPHVREDTDDTCVEWDRLVHERGEDSLNDTHVISDDAEIDAETMTRLEELRDTCQTEDSADWSVLRDINSIAKLGHACEILNLGALRDDQLSGLLHALITAELSYARCHVLLQHSLRLKIEQLQYPASRTLLAAVQHVTRLHPKPFLDAVLVPLVLNPASGTTQYEIIQRTTRDCLPLEENISFLRTLLTSTQPWSELTVQCLQQFLNKLELDTSLFDMLVAQLQRQVTCLAHSNKFSAFILALIVKYPEPSRTRAEIFRQISSKCTGFMVAKTLQKLDELTK